MGKYYIGDIVDEEKEVCCFFITVIVINLQSKYLSIGYSPS